MLNLEEPPLGYEKGCSASVPLQNLAILLTRMLVKANYGGVLWSKQLSSWNCTKTTKLFHVSQTGI